MLDPEMIEFIENKLDKSTESIKEHIDLKLEPVCTRLNAVETEVKASHDFIVGVKAIKWMVFLVAPAISFIVSIIVKVFPFGNHK